MAVVEHPVKLVLVEMICEKCQSGAMCSDNSVNLTSPPTYDHICNSCGAKETLDRRYPILSYRFDDDYEFYREAYQYDNRHK